MIFPRGTALRHSFCTDARSFSMSRVTISLSFRRWASLTGVRSCAKTDCRETLGAGDSDREMNTKRLLFLFFFSAPPLLPLMPTIPVLSWSRESSGRGRRVPRLQPRHLRRYRPAEIAAIVKNRRSNSASLRGVYRLNDSSYE